MIVDINRPQILPGDLIVTRDFESYADIGSDNHPRLLMLTPHTRGLCIAVRTYDDLSQIVHVLIDDTMCRIYSDNITCDSRILSHQTGIFHP